MRNECSVQGRLVRKEDKSNLWCDPEGTETELWHPGALEQLQDWRNPKPSQCAILLHGCSNMLGSWASAEGAGHPHLPRVCSHLSALSISISAPLPPTASPRQFAPVDAP